MKYLVSTFGVRMSAAILLFLSLATGFAVGVQFGVTTGALAGMAVATWATFEPSYSLGALNGYTLLDLAARSGKGVHAVMEGVLTYAPELSVIPCFPRRGLEYATLIRTELPSGDFRQVGGGVGLQKSAWKREVGSMTAFEAQMAVPEDIVIATMNQDESLVMEDVLADEAIATVKGSAIRMGAQTWYGNSISKDGFAGLSGQVDTANLQVDAGGSAGADSSSVYLVYLDPNPVNPTGVHYLLGNGGRMTMDEAWIKQRIPLASDPTKFYMAYLNNFMSYVGLVLPRSLAIARVINVTQASKFTDAVGATLLQKLPYALTQDKGNWRWFMNTAALLSLQSSRATVNVATSNQKGVAGTGVYPDIPESCQGIKIQVTDSLVQNERAGAHQ